MTSDLPGGSSNVPRFERMKFNLCKLAVVRKSQARVAVPGSGQMSVPLSLMRKTYYLMTRPWHSFRQLTGLNVWIAEMNVVV